MTRKPIHNLALLALVSLIVGIVIATFGTTLLLAPYLVSAGNKSPTNTQEAPAGFSFATTANLVQARTYFELDLSNLNFEKGTINATLKVDFQCNDWAPNNLWYNSKITYFMLQVPTRIADVSVVFQSYRAPEFFGGKMTYQNGNGTDSTSLIIVTIPTENFTLDRMEDLAFNFTMKDAFFKANSFTNQLYIPFSTHLDSVFVANYFNPNDPSPTNFNTPLMFMNSATASLYLEQPNTNFVISQMMPVPSGIHYYQGNTHYSWDVKAISTSFGSDSIILTIEDLTAKDKIASRDAFSWFLLGLGTPIVLTSIFEYLKVRGDYKIERKKVTIKPALLIALVIFVVLLVLMLLFNYLLS